MHERRPSTEDNVYWCATALQPTPTTSTLQQASLKIINNIKIIQMCL
jgi:hypothetical protein